MLNVFNRKEPKKHDRGSVQKLILQELPRIRRFAYALTQNHHDMEDLLQALVEKLLIQSIPLEVKPLPWMLKVAKNMWIDELRKRKTRGNEIAQDNAPAESSEDVEGSLTQEQQMKKVLEAINHLPEPQRIVISLVMSAEMSYADTAAILDIPIGTVMSRLARARETLGLMLGNDR